MARNQSFTFEDRADRSARYRSRRRQAEQSANEEVFRDEYRAQTGDKRRMSPADMKTAMRGTAATGARSLTVGQPGDYWSQRFQQSGNSGVAERPRPFFPQLVNRPATGGGVVTAQMGRDGVGKAGLWGIPGAPGASGETAPAAPQIGDTRPAQGGGMEQLMESKSGPRWAAGIPSPPPVSLPDRSMGPTILKREYTGPGDTYTGMQGTKADDALNLAHNMALAAPGGATRAPVTPKPFTYDQAAPGVMASAGTGKNVAGSYGTAFSTNHLDKEIASKAPGRGGNRLAFTGEATLPAPTVMTGSARTPDQPAPVAAAKETSVTLHMPASSALSAATASNPFFTSSPSIRKPAALDTLGDRLAAGARTAIGIPTLGAPIPNIPGVTSPQRNGAEVAGEAAGAATAMQPRGIEPKPIDEEERRRRLGAFSYR